MKNTLLFIVTLLVCASVHAQVYKWVDADGKVHFGDSLNADLGAPEEIDVLPPNSAIVPDDLPPPPAEEVEKARQKSAEIDPMTAEKWARLSCQPRVRLRYETRYGIACLPIEEVNVWVCKDYPPDDFRYFFGNVIEHRPNSGNCEYETYPDEVVFFR
ncbi:MAG: DUF4124 domain-containing protein [Pseudomonadales bacterium]